MRGGIYRFHHFSLYWFCNSAIVVFCGIWGFQIRLSVYENNCILSALLGSRISYLDRFIATVQPGYLLVVAEG